MAMLDTGALMQLNLPLALAKFLGSSMDPNGFNAMQTTTGGLCSDCTVLASKIDVIFENGTRADVSTGVSILSTSETDLNGQKLTCVDIIGISPPRYCFQYSRSKTVSGYNVSWRILLLWKRYDRHSDGLLEQFCWHVHQ